MTGQFLQRKIWSLTTLPPHTQPLLVFSVYPTWYHSVTFATSSFFPIIFSHVPALLSVFYISPIMFHSPLFIHLHVTLLIPSHLLSSALIHTVSLPPLPEPFPQLSHFHLLLSVSLHSSWFISSLLVVSSIPLTPTCYRTSPSLFTSGFPFAILYLIPMSFVTFPIVTQSFTCAVLLSLFKAQGHKCMHVVVGQYQYFKTHLFQNIKLPHWKMNKAKRMNTDVNVY